MGTFLHKFTVKNLYIKKNVSDNFNFIDIYLFIFIRKKKSYQSRSYVCNVVYFEPEVSKVMFIWFSHKATSKMLIFIIV